MKIIKSFMKLSINKKLLVIFGLFLIFGLLNSVGLSNALDQEDFPSTLTAYQNYEPNSPNYYDEELLLSEASQETGFRQEYHTGSIILSKSEKNQLLWMNAPEPEPDTKISGIQVFIDDTNQNILDIDYSSNKNYNATYSFENDENNAIGTNISFVDNDNSGVDCEARKKYLYNNHLHVMRIYDNNNIETVDISNNFENQSIGTVEFWISTTDKTKITSIYLKDEIENIGINFRIRSSEFEYFDGIRNTIMPIDNNRWYHVRFDFNCTSDTFDIYIDNELKISSANFWYNVDSFSTLSIQSNILSYEYYTYFDAIGYSWDSNYSIGDNLIGEPIIDDDYDIEVKYVFDCIPTINVGGIGTWWNCLLELSEYQFHLNYYRPDGFGGGIDYYYSLDEPIETFEFSCQVFEYFDYDIGYYVIGVKFDYYINNVFYKTVINTAGNVFSTIRTKVFLHSIECKNLEVKAKNSFKGFRAFYRNDDELLVGYYNLPRYDEYFSLQEYSKKEIDSNKYWSYTTYQLTEANKLEVSFKQEIIIGNTKEIISFEYEFQKTKSVIYNAKFYYDDNIVRGKDWGSWLWGSFNWLRDGLASIVNALLLGIQFLLYLLVAGLNIILGYLFIDLIAPFLWNELVYWFLYALVWVLFYLYVLLVYLFGWLFYLIEPLLEFIFTVIVPFVVDIFVNILSWIIAVFLYLISLGQANIFEIQQIVESILSNIANVILDGFYYIGMYLPELLLYSFVYIINVGLLFLKFEYVKAKGFVNRANQIQSSLDSYIIPIRWVYNVLIKLKNFIFGWI